MTLLEEIEALNWNVGVVKIKKVLKKLLILVGNFLSRDLTTYQDATTPFTGTEETIVNQNGDWKKVLVSEFTSNNTGNYIPLTGTESGSPVTGTVVSEGDIVLSNSMLIGDGNNFGIKYDDTTYENTLHIFDDDYAPKSFSFHGSYEDGDKQSNLNVFTDGSYEVGVYNNSTNNISAIFSTFNEAHPLYVNGILIDNLKNNNPGGGLHGRYYYGAEYEDNTYVQKKYVVDPNTLIETLNNADNTQLATIKTILGIV